MSTYLILIIIGLSIVSWLAYSGRIRLPGDRDYIHPDLLSTANGSRSLAKRNIFNFRSWTRIETREKLFAVGLFLWVANNFLSLIRRLRR